MKVVLVNPPYTFWKPGARSLRRIIGCEAPLGLLSIASYARDRLSGLDIRIIDAAARGMSVAAAVAEIVRLRPDVLGMSVVTVAAGNARRIAAAVKARCRDTVVVAGGPHMSGLKEAALSECGHFDFGVVGEGEETFALILQALREGRKVLGLSGTMSRDGGGAIVRASPRPFIRDLDTLPFPAWDLLAGFPKRYEANLFFSPGGPSATLVTSRGCPFHCAFCDQSTFGNEYRAFSPEYVFRAAQALQRDYGVRYLVFCDDTFTVNRSRVLKICELLSTLRPKVAWSCDANVMTVDREMLRAMRRAGCWSVSFGLESGSREVLASLDKDIDLVRAAEVIRWTRAEGIRAKGLFMLGTPEESLDTIRATREFIKGVPLTSINLSKFTPYPGTRCGASFAGELAGLHDMMNGMNFIVPSRHLDIGQLEREYRGIIHDFFQTPSTMPEQYSITIGNWQNFVRFMAAAPLALGLCLPRRISPGRGDDDV